MQHSQNKQRLGDLTTFIKTDHLYFLKLIIYTLLLHVESERNDREMAAPCAGLVQPRASSPVDWGAGWPQSLAWPPGSISQAGPRDHVHAWPSASPAAHAARLVHAHACSSYSCSRGMAASEPLSYLCGRREAGVGCSPSSVPNLGGEPSCIRFPLNPQNQSWIKS